MADLEVLCVGSATHDTIAVTDRYPSEDSRVEARAIVTAGGGPAATAAVALARLGIAVGFAGVVGDDDTGRAVRRGLEAEGVDTRWLVGGGTHTGASVIVVSGDASRTIFTRPAPMPAPESIPVDAAPWIHVDQTGYPAVAAARSAGLRARISIDAGNPVPALALRDVALYAPTRSALLERYPGDVDRALDRAHADGAAAVVMTDGARGARYSGGGARGAVPAVEVDAVSTLGAGDVFHGALLAGIVGGGDLGSATALASWVAARSCLALDGRSAIPFRDDVHAEYSAQTHRERGDHAR
ncbi:carbohydrate kinase family protein [Agromyces silvae]|uniref:carbohydrate kinase family protein n=1 Tax=Agromyces silvae TaxID=3388266 RepID=UPI00280B1660|nr:PfkB family carbohydrate kinase [Agromyces protaetiae]